MRRVYKQRVIIASLLAMLLLLMSACSSNSNTGSGSPVATASASESTGASAGATADASQLEPVNLIWYYIGPEQDDVKTVEAAVNEITKAKINATVELKAGGWDYDKKMNPILASREEVDIIWTSNWALNYLQNQRRGAFIALDDLIDQYAPKLRDIMPAYALDAMKVDGRIYAIPSYQTFANQSGFRVRESVFQKHPLDVSTIKTFEDMGTYLQTIKDTEPGFTPIYQPNLNYFTTMLYSYGMQTVGIDIGVVRNNDDSMQVVNAYETPEFKKHLQVLRDWYNKGYIHPDAAIQGGEGVVYAVNTHNVLKPGGEINVFDNVDGSKENAVYVPVSPAYIPNGIPMATANAISQTSRNPERAMMFLELVNTDKELFNLLSYGIEGVHYTKLDDTYVKAIPDSGYNPNTNWVFGNTFNEYLVEGTSKTVHEDVLAQNDAAEVSKLMGFVFNPEPVQTELVNIKSVEDEYKPLHYGAIDVDKYLPEFLSRLKQAGADAVIVEAQRQLDEWKKANG